jgi:chromosomal replication initiator protein
MSSLSAAVNRARFASFIPTSAAVPDRGIDLKRKPEIAPVPVAPVVVPIWIPPETETNILAVQARIAKIRAELEQLETRYGELVQLPRPRIKVEDIQRECAKHYGCKRVELLSARRDSFTVGIRHTAMYLSKTLTALSLPQIGRQFGGRDHTTVLHAVRKIAELRKTDPVINGDLEMFEARLSAV